jgi:tRNA1(Val) A37 N6-methylase TrmN6
MPDDRSLLPRALQAEVDAGEITDDAVLGGRLRLLQPRRGHRFGHDAILLAAATGAHAGERVVDLGAGVGAAGLALAQRVPGLAVTLVEIDEGLAALAAENARRNGLADRVNAIALDVGAPAPAFAAAGLGDGCAQRVLMNPPFHDESRANVSPDPRRRLAHAAPREMISVWVEAARRLLASGGVLTLIWRADGVGDVTAALADKLALDAVLPIRPRPSADPIRVIVRAVKGGRGLNAVLPGLDLNDDEGRPTPEAEAVLRQGTELPLASF